MRGNRGAGDDPRRALAAPRELDAGELVRYIVDAQHGEPDAGATSRPRSSSQSRPTSPASCRRPTSGP